MVCWRLAQRPFPLSWFEPFDYPNGDLVGQGTWVGAAIATASPAVNTAAVRGHATDASSAFADDAFELNVARPFIFETILKIGNPGVLDMMSIFFGNADGGAENYIGVDLDFTPGTRHCVMNADGGYSGIVTKLFNLGSNSIKMIFDGVNLSLTLNDEVVFAPEPIDISGLNEPYPFIFFDNPGSAEMTIESMRVTA